MKRLIIIVEGDSEIEFVKKTLAPYFASKGFYSVDTFKLKHSKGGLTKYVHLQTDIINLLYEGNLVITTLVDYYALPKDFPNYEEAQQITNLTERLGFLVNSVIKDIQSKQGHEIKNLLPYIQLHEFEALCFSSFKGFKDNFSEDEADYKAIQEIINSFATPELINDGIATAPSKRLIKLIQGYNKIIYGNIIIESIGIDQILEKCPNFKRWVEDLLQLLA